MIPCNEKEDNTNARTSRSRRLIAVVADDFGVTRQIDDRILKAVSVGFVTDISLIVNVDDARLNESAGRLAASGAPSTGLHLCLFSGSTFPLFPVRRGPETRCLTSESGALAQPGIFTMLLPWPRHRLAAAETEMRAQIERFLTTGLPLHFINSHRNALMHAQLFGVCAKLAREYGVPYLRIVCERPVPFSQRSAALFLMAGHTSRCISAARASQLRHADFFRGFAEGLHLDAVKLGKILSGLRPGLTELVVHPGADERILKELTSPKKVDALFASHAIQRFPLSMAGRR